MRQSQRTYRWPISVGISSAISNMQEYCHWEHDAFRVDRSKKFRCSQCMRCHTLGFPPTHNPKSPFSFPKFMELVTFPTSYFPNVFTYAWIWKLVNAHQIITWNHSCLHKTRIPSRFRTRNGSMRWSKALSSESNCTRRNNHSISVIHRSWLWAFWNNHWTPPLIAFRFRSFHFNQDFQFSMQKVKQTRP
jgi:hypothetical protein